MAGSAQRRWRPALALLALAGSAVTAHANPSGGHAKQQVCHEGEWHLTLTCMHEGARCTAKYCNLYGPDMTPLCDIDNNVAVKVKGNSCARFHVVKVASQSPNDLKWSSTGFDCKADGVLRFETTAGTLVDPGTVDKMLSCGNVDFDITRKEFDFAETTTSTSTTTTATTTTKTTTVTMKKLTGNEISEVDGVLVSGGASLHTFQLNADSLWHEWPGLSKVIELDAPTVVMATYQTATPAEDTYIMSKLFVDGVEQKQTRSLMGRSTYASTIGSYVCKLQAGLHTFTVKYKTHGASIVFDEGGLDWQTRALNVVALPGAVVQTINPLTAFTMTSNNSWTEWPGLSASLMLEEPVVVLAAYQTATPAGGEVASKLMIDGIEQQLTRSITGDTAYSSTFGMFAGTLEAGEHKFSVMYRTTGAGEAFAEGGGEWQTRALTVVTLPRARTYVLNPLSEFSMVADPQAWTEWPGLSNSIKLDIPAAVLALYQTATGGGEPTSVASKLFLDGTEQPQTRCRTGATEYNTNFGVYLGRLEAGQHTFSARYRADKAGFSFTRGGADWQNRALTVIVLNKPPPQFTWELIAKQNVDNALFDAAAEDSFLMNEDRPEADAYMTVGNVDFADISTQFGGKYRFKLVYDSHISLEWMQSSWLTEPTIQGFECVSPQDCGPSSEQPGNQFMGLGRSSKGSPSVLDGDGSLHWRWMNSVGTIERYHGGIPGWDQQTHTTMQLYMARQAPSLSHESYSGSFRIGRLTNGVKAWTNRPYNYTSIPTELLDAMFFSGPYDTIPTGSMTLKTPTEGVVYIWGEDNYEHRDGGVLELGWEQVGQMHWSTNGTVRIFRKHIGAETSLQIPVRFPWTGGVAFQKSLTLTHSSGDVGFHQRTLTKNQTVAWIDDHMNYSDVPRDLQGATLFAGPHKSLPDGELTLNTPSAGTVYIWGDAGSNVWAGGDSALGLRALGFEDAGTMKWGAAGTMRILQKELQGASMQIPVRQPWIGGVAFQKAPMLLHSTSALRFQMRKLQNGTQAWTDQNYAYTHVPYELKGSVLFAGPHRGMPTGTVTFTAPTAGIVYIWGEDSPELPWNNQLPNLGWDTVGTMMWGDTGLVRIYSRNIGYNSSVVVNVHAPWIGGAAFRKGTGEETILPLSQKEVSYQDTDGDRVTFRLNDNGILYYYVNDQQIVHHITELTNESNTIHLLGTASGAWSGARRSTVHAGNEPTVARVVELFKRRASVVPVYDFWIKGNLDHIFHTGAAQDDEEMRDVMFYAFDEPTKDTLPVYDFWNSLNSDHTCHLGAPWDGEEKGKVLFHAFPHHEPGTVPVYAFWNEGNSEYTMHAGERWEGEKKSEVVFYAYPYETDGEPHGETLANPGPAGEEAQEESLHGEQACFQTGVTYMPLDMDGSFQAYTVNASMCRARCKATRGCAHFTFFLSDKSCHVADENSDRQATANPGIQTVGGTMNCAKAVEFDDSTAMERAEHFWIPSGGAVVALLGVVAAGVVMAGVVAVRSSRAPLAVPDEEDGTLGGERQAEPGWSLSSALFGGTRRNLRHAGHFTREARYASYEDRMLLSSTLS